MDRSRVLERLDKATDLAAQMAINSGSVLPKKKKSMVVGCVSIQKNTTGLYNILNPDDEVVFKDISVFDVAIIVAQRFSLGEKNAVNKVLFLESCFSKHHSDMSHYLSCIKRAKQNKDIERMCILEDKFQTSEMKAKELRDSISSFKRAR